MLDNPFFEEEDDRLMVNTATGRFLVKKMPLLREYYVVAVTADGLLVLAGREVPHLACVLNPFTRYMVRFAARMIPGVGAAAVSGSSPLYLVLYNNGPMKLYRANPNSESFVRYKKKYGYPLVRKAVQGCVAMDGHEDVLPPLPAAVVTKITDLMTTFVPQIPSDENLASRKRCFIVQSAGEMLVVFKLLNGMKVFKMEMGGNALEPVHSIGNRALFIGGCQRCLSVDADKFPSIEANCIYFIDRICSPSIGIYHLKDGQQGHGASQDAPSVDLPIFQLHAVNVCPITIILLLSIYTLNIQAALATKIVEYEDGILEQLKTGQLSFSDLLLHMEDSDSDD
jgi:hypothetical protein